MEHTFIPRGVCTTRITFDLDGNILKNVHFTGGCNGNAKAVSALVEGMTVDQVKERLSGIQCGFKSTSCSDQLVKGLIEAEEEQTPQK